MSSCSVCISTLSLQVLLSYAQRDFYSALTEKQQAPFHAAALKLFLIILFCSPFFALYAFVQVREGVASRGKIGGGRRPEEGRWCLFDCLSLGW